MKIYCCKCEKEVEAQLTKGSEIYPHRPDLYSKYFYKCPYCGNYVGCHLESTRPLGVIPTPALKEARKMLHAYMDPIWKNGLMTRTALYRLISKRIGRTFHNGTTRSVTECVDVMKIIKDIKKNFN